MSDDVIKIAAGVQASHAKEALEDLDHEQEPLLAAVMAVAHALLAIHYDLITLREVAESAESS